MSVELFKRRPNFGESRSASHLVVTPVEFDETLVLHFGKDYVVEFIEEGNVLITIERLVSP